VTRRESRPWSARSKSSCAGRKKSMAVPPSSSSATSSRFLCVASVRPQSSPLQNCGCRRRTSPLQQKIKITGPRGDRQPYLGRHRDLAHPRSRAGRQACRTPHRAHLERRGAGWPKPMPDDCRRGRRLYEQVELKDTARSKNGHLARTAPVEGSDHRPLPVRLIQHGRMYGERTRSQLINEPCPNRRSV